MSESGGPEAGWYQDPDGEGQRYWDGTQWTEHRKASHSPTPAASREVPGTFWALTAAVVAVTVGSLGPWATNNLASQGGLEGDGWITLGLAAAVAVALFRGYSASPVRVSWTPLIAGLLIAGVGIYDASEIESAGNTRLFGETVDLANTGWGLYLVIAGGIAMVVLNRKLR